MKPRTPVRPGTKALLGLIAGFALMAGACESDPTGPSGACEVIYATSDPPGPSGIEVHNATGGGLSVLVDSDRYAGAGADMAAGACEVWAYPAGTYQLTLQRCEQGDPGSSACTTALGAPAVRSVTVQSGSRTVVRVTPALVP